MFYNQAYLGVCLRALDFYCSSKNCCQDFDLYLFPYTVTLTLAKDHDLEHFFSPLQTQSIFYWFQRREREKERKRERERERERYRERTKMEKDKLYAEEDVKMESRKGGFVYCQLPFCLPFVLMACNSITVHLPFNYILENRLGILDPVAMSQDLDGDQRREDIVESCPSPLVVAQCRHLSQEELILVVRPSPQVTKKYVQMKLYANFHYHCAGKSSDIQISRHIFTFLDPQTSEHRALCFYFSQQTHLQHRVFLKSACTQNLCCLRAPSADTVGTVTQRNLSIVMLQLMRPQ